MRITSTLLPAVCLLFAATFLVNRFVGRAPRPAAAPPGRLSANRVLQVNEIAN